MNQTVWAIIVLAGAVVIGRAVDRTLRRRWRGRFNSPWGEPEVTPAREGAGRSWFLLYSSALRCSPVPVRSRTLSDVSARSVRYAQTKSAIGG